MIALRHPKLNCKSQTTCPMRTHKKSQATANRDSCIAWEQVAACSSQVNPWNPPKRLFLRKRG